MPRLYYTDGYVIPLPSGHRFPMAKYRLARDLLASDGVFQLEPAPLASSDVIKLAHAPEYVESFLTGALDATAMRRIGFPWSEALVQRTLASVGGTLSATRDALECGWGGNLAGGTHHAFRNAGSGFCVFNDIAVAIQWLRNTGQIARAAVIDLDVHQGDGTAEIFGDDAQVLTVSLHCETNFPFRKQQSSIDISLPDGTGDSSYLETLAAILPRVLDFEPDIIFYQSGVDTLASDALDHLQLTHSGLMERDRLVCQTARDSGIPLVVTMGGGYSVPIELTAQAHANTFRVTSQAFARQFSTPAI